MTCGKNDVHYEASWKREMLYTLPTCSTKGNSSLMCYIQRGRKWCTPFFIFTLTKMRSFVFEGKRPESRKGIPGDPAGFYHDMGTHWNKLTMPILFLFLVFSCYDQCYAHVCLRNKFSINYLHIKLIDPRVFPSINK